MNKEDKKPSILLVDEDQFLLGIYSKRLQEDGWKIDIALSAADAKDKIDAGNYDVVVLDVLIGKMPGMKLLEELREKGLMKSARVIILTNDDSEENLDRAQKLGAEGYIVKSHNTPSEIVDEINNIYNN